MVLNNGQHQGRSAHVDLDHDAAMRSPNGVVTYLPPSSDGTKAMRSWRKPKRYEAPADLQRALSTYLDSLQDPDGSWIKAPTLSGAGLFLGFNSRSWHVPYSKHEEFKPTIDWLKFFVETWREEQVLMPAKGVYPQGLMFLMNRLDASAAADGVRDVSSNAADHTAERVQTLLDGLSLELDDKDAVEDASTSSARAELDRLSRMTTHERLIWHKAKQIEAEAELEG